MSVDRLVKFLKKWFLNRFKKEDCKNLGFLRSVFMKYRQELTMMVISRLTLFSLRMDVTQFVTCRQALDEKLALSIFSFFIRFTHKKGCSTYKTVATMKLCNETHGIFKALFETLHYFRSRILFDGNLMFQSGCGHNITGGNGNINLFKLVD